MANHTIISLVGLGAILFYYLLMWYRDGRDPDKGIIIPQYETPRDLPPAVLRYVWKGFYDHRCFGAALLDIVVKGICEIREHVDTMVPVPNYKLKIVREKGLEELSDDELTIVRTLFPPGTDEIVLGSFDDKTIWRAAFAQKRRLSQDHRRNFFASGGKYWKGSLAILTATLLGVMISGMWWGAFAVLMAVVFLWLLFWWWVVIVLWREGRFFHFLLVLVMALASSFGPCS